MSAEYFTKLLAHMEWADKRALASLHAMSDPPPQAVELVPNAANKYLVASYTPGLQKNADGSISIYMARQLPAGVPAANWLPIPPRRFNVMLRDYGPLGSVLDGTYVPPGIEKVH